MAGFGASGREQPCGCMASVSCGEGVAGVSSWGGRCSSCLASQAGLFLPGSGLVAQRQTTEYI